MAEGHDGMDLNEPPEDEREFRRMMESLGHEDLRRMIEDLTEKIRANPGDTEARFLRGLTYAGMGEPHRAVADLGRAIDLEPGLAEARYHRGLVYRYLGELEQALADFNAAVELEPNHGLARHARGITNLNLGEFDRALQDSDAVIGLDPDNAAALRGRGVALGSMDRHDEAVRDLDRSLALDPDNGETLTAMGLTHTSLGQHELAIEDYTRVVELNPGDTAVRCNRGIANMHLERHGRAIEDFSAVIEIEPDHAAAHLARGFARESLGEHGEALGDYDRVIELTPEDPEGYHGRGCAYAALGQPRRAVENFGRAIALDPENVESLRKRATLYRELGEPDRAVRDYDEIIRLDPEDPSVREERELALKEVEAEPAGGAAATPTGRERRVCPPPARAPDVEQPGENVQPARSPLLRDGAAPGPSGVSAALCPRSGAGPVLPGTGAVRLGLGQHRAVAPLVHQVGHRHLAPAVVASAVGVFHLGAPGHPAADAHGAAAGLVAASPRAAGAAHHHAVAGTLLPGHHLDLGGHHQLRRRGPEQHPVQLRQNLSRRVSLAVHDLGEMTGADVGQPGGLVLADFVGFHAVPQGAWVNAAGLGGFDPGRTVQRLFHLRLDRRAHVLPAPRHLRHVADRHPHPVGQFLLGQAQLPGALPDAGALTLHEAALPVDDALPGDLAQDRRGPLPQQGSPGPAPAGHRGQVAVADAHPVRQLLQGEAVPPGRSPKLALGLAPGLPLFYRCGDAVVVEVCLGVVGVDVGSRLHVASSETQKAGPPSQ